MYVENSNGIRFAGKSTFFANQISVSGAATRVCVYVCVFKLCLYLVSCVVCVCACESVGFCACV